MSFIWPVMLFSLVLIPLFIVIYLNAQRRRRRLVANFGNLGFTQGTTARKPGTRRHIPPLVSLFGLAILLVALARPQTIVSLPKVEGTVMLAFDVSGSMSADDLKPTRIEAAKAAARDFVEKQPSSVQIGVVAYSDNGFSVQIPTNEKDTILASIDRLSPERGTSVGNGILSSLKAIDQSLQPPPLVYSNRTPTVAPTPTPVPKGTYTSAVIVLLTDGDNNESPDPLAAAQTAADRGVRIYTVGIGSTAGTTIHVNGFTVHTALDEATLKQISQMTGGEYFNAESAQDLLKIYDNLDPQLIIQPEKMEITSLFAGASILVLMIGGTFSLLWFSRVP
jgi:Ca-activated chloride channel family protein